MKFYKGIVIYAEKFEEKGIILHCLTSDNKIKSGLTKGISKVQNIVEIGNLLNFKWFGKENSLGNIFPEIEKPFGAVLSMNKKTCYEVFCLTFLINSLFRFEINHLFNLYELLYFYFDNLYLKILNNNGKIFDNLNYNYFAIEKIIIKNSGWADFKEDVAFQEKDLKLFFHNLHIKNYEKFFFHRNKLY